MQANLGESNYVTIQNTYININININNIGGSYYCGNRILNVLIDIIYYLSKYDYGTVFLNPIDTRNLPDYKKKNIRPMCYSHIITKILKGDYINHNNLDFNDIIVNTISDIHLVLHNALYYNKEHSLYYRMSKVQQTVFASLFQKSVEPYINDIIKK